MKGVEKNFAKVSAFENRLELLVTQDINTAEQLNEIRSAFIANVSHELRTPLTVISGFLETLADMPDLPHLTEHFYRTDAGRNRKNGGTGLGLSIAKHALANHRAVLNISSSVGEGSTFSTTLEKAEAAGEP